MNLAICVLTVPSRITLYSKSLLSACHQFPTIFSLDNEPPNHYGSWGNRLRGSLALLQAHPTASHYLILEDDAILHPQWYDELLRRPFPPDCAILSLYKPAGRVMGPKHCTDPPHLYSMTGECLKCGRGWINVESTLIPPVDHSGYSKLYSQYAMWGSVAYLFSDWAFRKFVGDHRITATDKPCNRSDYKVQEWLRENNLSLYVTHPSFANHNSTIKSACGHGVNGRAMRSEDFDETAPLTFVPRDQGRTHCTSTSTCEESTDRENQLNLPHHTILESGVAENIGTSRSTATPIQWEEDHRDCGSSDPDSLRAISPPL